MGAPKTTPRHVYEDANDDHSGDELEIVPDDDIGAIYERYSTTQDHILDAADSRCSKRKQVLVDDESDDESRSSLPSEEDIAIVRKKRKKRRELFADLPSRDEGADENAVLPQNLDASDLDPPSSKAKPVQNTNTIIRSNGSCSESSGDDDEQGINTEGSTCY